MLTSWFVTPVSLAVFGGLFLWAFQKTHRQLVSAYTFPDEETQPPQPETPQSPLPRFGRFDIVILGFLTLLFGLAIVQLKLPWTLSMLVFLVGGNVFYLAYVDHKTTYIPDRFQWIGFLLAVLFRVSLYQVTPHHHQEHPRLDVLQDIGIGMGVVLFLWASNHIYKWIRKIDGIGMGDIKMLLWASILLGSSVAYAIFIASFLSVLIQFGRMIRRSFSRSDSFPFGPALGFGVLTTLCFSLLF